MSRYIDADILKNLILKDIALADSMGKDLIGYTDALFHLKALPPADVFEVRHGEWEEHTYGELKCSVCGIVQEDYPHRYNYCPVCGAKMDGERKNYDT